MNGYNQLIDDFFHQQKQLLTNDFNIQENICICNHHFPLYASFCNHDRSGWMQMLGVKHTPNFCSEFCFFDKCLSITEAQLDIYFALCEKIRSQLTDASKSGHQCTMISLVVVSNALSSACRKKLRRYSSVMKYQTPLHGWSEIRICVVDITNGTVISSKDSTALKQRIVHGIAKEKTGFISQLFQ